MPANDPSKLRFLLPGVAVSETASRAHGPATRGQTAEVSALLVDLKVIEHFDLSAPSRAARQETTLEAAGDDILALEMEDGFILYTSAAQLADNLRRLRQLAAARSRSGTRWRAAPGHIRATRPGHARPGRLDSAGGFGAAPRPGKNQGMAGRSGDQHPRKSGNLGRYQGADVGHRKTTHTRTGPLPLGRRRRDAWRLAGCAPLRFHQGLAAG